MLGTICTLNVWASAVFKASVKAMCLLTISLQIDLSHELVVHPQFFGPKLRETIRQLLYEEVEGTSSGKYGYIIAVTEIIEVRLDVENLALPLAVVKSNYWRFSS